MENGPAGEKQKEGHMLDFRAVSEWAMALVALLATGGLIYWIIALVPRGRLLTCPGTGAMTFVEIGRASPGDGSAPKVTVQSCDMWPAYYQCTGRCLIGKKSGLWPKWGTVEIPEAGAKNRIPAVSRETWI
jgi:hypothetical protein